MATVRHRIARVDGEIHEDLFDLRAIGANAACVRREIEDELDVVPDHPFDETRNFEYDLVEVEQFVAGDLRTAEGQQLLRQRRCAFARLDDLREIFRDRTVGRNAPLRKRGVAEDDADEVVEIVRDPAREASERLDLLLLPELPFECIALLLQRLLASFADEE